MTKEFRKNIASIAKVKENDNKNKDSGKESDAYYNPDDPINRKIDFDSLKSVSSDVIGWIYLPDKSMCFDTLGIVNRGNVHLLKEFDLNEKKDLVNFLSYISGESIVKKDLNQTKIKDNNFIALSTCIILS